MKNKRGEQKDGGVIMPKEDAGVRGEERRTYFMLMEACQAIRDEKGHHRNVLIDKIHTLRMIPTRMNVRTQANER